jgi:hypothetical protein
MATTQIPAITHFQLAVNWMLQDNTTFGYGNYMATKKPLDAGMYINTKKSDLVFICNPNLKYNLQANLHN